MILCLGEAVADLVATANGRLVAPGRSFRLAAGGAPANVAVAAGLLGVAAVFLGKVGNDPFGWFLEETIAAGGVVAEIRRDASAPTPLAFVSLREGGEREFYFHPARPAYLEMTAAEVEEAIARRTNLSFFHFGGLTLAGEPARSAVLRGAELAARRGAVVTFDPNWRPSLWPDMQEGRRRLLEGAQAAEVVKMNEEEACLLSRCAEVSTAARWFVERGARLAVVTRGERGCHYAWAQGEGEVPGYQVAAVDTTGAGDAFMGAFLAGLQGRAGGRRELETALSRANAAGALATLRRGAIPAFPTARRLEKFLRLSRE